jgi:Cu/Zn superoxide dismutase
VGEGCQWNRHAGDLGNLVADADGNVAGDEKKFKDLYVSLNPKKTECVAGKAVVVRARADDFKTEADDGDAGEIVAVGVLKAV